MNPSGDPFDDIPSPWPEQGKRERKRYEVQPCLVCGRVHQYVGHDGKPAACNFCCTKHSGIGSVRGGGPR